MKLEIFKSRVEGECKDCEEILKDSYREDCSKCGPGMSASLPRMTLVGMDAVALFPSLSGKRTSKIVRKRIVMSRIKLEGFNWKKGMVYIKTNRSLTSGIPKEIRKFLPLRKSNQGVEPGMSSQSLRKDAAMENQWFFPYKNPGEEEVKTMVSIVAEIGVRVLWDNYCYDFGGETHLQDKGGPIGQRPTMAAARIIMNDFFEEQSC